MPGKLSWDDLSLTPGQIDQLRGYGYESADAVAGAVAGAPEAFKGVIDDVAIARIRKLAGRPGGGPYGTLGVPVSGEPPTIETDPQFELKRASVLERLKQAETEEERALYEQQLLDLYQRS